jgi:hypothetical protein
MVSCVLFTAAAAAASQHYSKFGLCSVNHVLYPVCCCCCVRIKYYSKEVVVLIVRQVKVVLLPCLLLLLLLLLRQDQVLQQGGGGVPLRPHEAHAETMPAQPARLAHVSAVKLYRTAVFYMCMNTKLLPAQPARSASAVCI